MTADDAYLTVSTAMPLTFTPAGWDSAQTVTVTAVDDAIETADSYNSTLSHTAVSDDANFGGSATVYFPVSEVRGLQVKFGISMRDTIDNIGVFVYLTIFVRCQYFPPASVFGLKLCECVGQCFHSSKNVLLGNVQQILSGKIRVIHVVQGGISGECAGNRVFVSTMNSGI